MERQVNLVVDASYWVKHWDETSDPRQQRMFLLGLISACTSLDNQDLLRTWLPRCFELLDLEAIEETILQTLLFAGFPKSIEALKTLREYAPFSGHHETVQEPHVAGMETSSIVYGNYHQRLLQMMDELHPELTRWMIRDGYGRVLSRSGLSLQDREIAVLASLMATGMSNQYKAHCRGAIYAGVKKVDILWFTNIFNAIIAADLQSTFEKLNEQALV